MYCIEVKTPGEPFQRSILSLGNDTYLSVLLLLEVTFVVLVGEIRNRRKWRLSSRRLQTHNCFTSTLKLRRNRQGKKANEGENVVLRFIKLKLRGALVAHLLCAWPSELYGLSLLVCGVVSEKHYTVEQILTSRFGSMSG